VKRSCIILLRAVPDYADAIFNLALLLQRSNKHPQAAEYWRHYLANDTQSEWARGRKILRKCKCTFDLVNALAPALVTCVHS
jgi:hypothetical protein